MRHRFFVPTVLIAATLAVFIHAVGYDFVGWDDDILIYENSRLIPPSLENTLHFWKEPRWLYMPLTYTVWSMLAWLSQQFPAEPYGLNPALFHAANIIVHLLSVLAVFSILKMLLAKGFREGGRDGGGEETFKISIAAGTGALIFALHPLQVEPVVWASELKDLLCGLFSFLAIREYLVFAFASKADEGSGKKRLHYVLACAAFLLALFSKPAAVVVPIVIFILDRWGVGRSFKRSVVALAGWFIVAGIFAVIAKSVQHSGAIIISPPIWARPFVAGDALAFYFYKLVFPMQLGIDYGRTPDYILSQWWGYATWLLPFAFAAAIFFAKRRVVWFVCFGIFAASLLPVLGLIPFLFQSRSTVADHYLYLPLLGVVLAVAWLILKHRTKTVSTAFVIIIILFAVRSSYQLPVWQDEKKLYLNALKINPSSSLANYNLGNILKKQGNFKEAIYRYKAALKIDPLSVDVRNNLGIALTQTGNLTEALYNYRQVVKYAPDNSNAHNNLGVTLDRLGKPDEAVRHYKQALRLDPANADAHNNLGLTLESQGKLDEAITSYKKAIELQPADANAHNNLGITLSKQGKYEQAIKSYSHALRIRPDFALAQKQLDMAKSKISR